MGYLPLSEYGVVGNLETCALVSSDGSVDWLCLPSLSSPSVFASLLDDEVGGRFALRPAGEYESEQSYVEDTNVLRTTFATGGGTLAVDDFMPIRGERYPDGTPRRAVFRRATCESGAVDLEADFRPRFDYARADTTLSTSDRGVVARTRSESAAERALLAADRAFDVGEDAATGRWTLEAEETAWFTFQYDARSGPDPERNEAAYDRTVEYWREWANTCDHPKRCFVTGPYHDQMERSALVLKLLDHWETDAIAAAPTTSLPEDVGGVRNWDYRFSWLRDAAFTVQALYKLGHVEAARGYFEWCMSQLPDDRGARTRNDGADGPVTNPLFRPLYGLREDSRMAETTLDNLEGYRGSSPVRIGNEARKQRQLDIYGELVLAVYAVSRHHEGASVADANWEGVRTVVNHVCDAWEKPDLGIWEVRTEPKQFVHSKVMCWAALDRAIRLVEEGDADGPDRLEGDVARWKDNRARLRERVLDEGYDESMNAFTRTFEGSELDAACLRIPVVEFLPFDDDRVQGTIDAVMDELATDEGLVYRYQGGDGLPGEENPFVMCSFWLVDALALSGRIEEAQTVFDNVLSYASPHGLLAEEVDPDTGEQRGNYPQAFSHIGLVNSAVYLRKAMGEPDDQGVVGERASSEMNGDETRVPPGR